MRVILAVIAIGVGSASSASAAAPTPLAPAVFGVEGRSVLLSVHAEGAQVYECKAGPGGGLAWTLREPIATLIADGKTVGRHFAGPNWQIGDELIKGKLVQTAPAPAPGDIPWFKLDVAQHTGSGPLADATLILRIATRGGALTGPCEMQGAFRGAPYSAEYVFLR